MWKLCDCSGCDCQYVDIAWRSPEENAELDCKCYEFIHHIRGNEIHWLWLCQDSECPSFWGGSCRCMEVMK